MSTHSGFSRLQGRWLEVHANERLQLERRRFATLVIAVSLCAAACTPQETFSPSDAGFAIDAVAPPVSSATLSGTIAGQAFSPQGSFSTFSTPDPSSPVEFLIFDAPADCTTTYLVGGNYVQVTLPWPLTAGLAWTLNANLHQVDVVAVDSH